MAVPFRVRSSRRGSIPLAVGPGPVPGPDALARRPTFSDQRLTSNLRGRYLLAVDLVGIVIAAYVALAFRFDQISAPIHLAAFPLVVGLLLAVRTIFNIRLGLYTRHWRFASVPDLERIVLCVALGSATSVIIFYGCTALAGATWGDGFPRSFWIAELLLSIAVLGGVRFGIRAASERFLATAVQSDGDLPATLLYGAGQAGTSMARWAHRDPSAAVRPVGFLDDDRGLRGAIVAGLRVFGGVEAMQRAVAATGATTILVTMPSAPGVAIRRVVDAAMALHLVVRTVPSVSELLSGSLDTLRIRQVRVEDLLRRPIVNEHADGVAAIISGQTVLITGGAGSIGSELARQVLDLGPRRLILVDRAESPLYLISRELETRLGRSGATSEIAVHLANVASRASMRRIIEAERPSVIFHAAAYKHVPMMEEHPSDAAYVNIVGTREVLDAAEAAGVERFVLVSTDKAVNSTSVMGASKRVAELLVADTARRTGRPFVAVRFGNVLGSTGSVVPIFQSQLENGEALTITHPDMTRYFMTIPESAWLILDAAALGRTGDLFVLDMGEPVRVIDLARDLVRLAGRDPESQPIEVIGLRPGEKLHEELFYDMERVEPTSSAKVLRAITSMPHRGVREDVERILAMATGDDEAALGAAILACAQASGEPVKPMPERAPQRSVDAVLAGLAGIAAGPGARA